MNIIELMKNIINEYPGIDEFSNNIHIDYTENVNGDFGIYSVDDSLIKKTIVGDEYRRHSFVLYANNQTVNDYDRLNNSTFLLQLGSWLERQKDLTFVFVTGFDSENNPIEKTATVTKITTANAMLFSVPSGNINNGCTYHIQIYIEYKINN